MRINPDTHTTGIPEFPYEGQATELSGAGYLLWQLRRREVWLEN